MFHRSRKMSKKKKKIKLMLDKVNSRKEASNKPFISICSSSCPMFPKDVILIFGRGEKVGQVMNLKESQQ